MAVTGRMPLSRDFVACGLRLEVRLLDYSITQPVSGVAGLKMKAWMMANSDQY